MDKIHLKPIGFVRTDLNDDEIREGKKENKSIIEIYPEFVSGLDGLQGYSHIFILAYLNKLRLDQIGVLKVKPKRLLNRGFKKKDLPTLGVFSIDSPSRPNPISLTLVFLEKIEKNVLIVKGLDLFNNTPVLDIKAYHYDYRSNTFSVPIWYNKLMDKEGHI
jgi:tRNA-Thr(GGU) m(6)t(6)A37 methyltransferase TsaA